MRVILTCLAVISVISVISCTKTTNVKTTVYDTTTVVVRDTIYSRAKNPIIGLWIGTYKIIGGNAADSFYLSFDIDANGRMITLDNDALGSSASSAGPWQLSGTTFSASLSALNSSSTVQTTTAVYDSVAGSLNGQALYTTGTGYNTTFLLFRVQ
jgi:hypothetical protein